MNLGKEKNSKFKLGQGTYGSVFKFYSYHYGKQVAVKVVKILQQDDGIPSTTLREMSILKQLSHKNIVKILEVYFQFRQNEKTVNIIFELVPQDLSKFLRKQAPVSKYSAKKIIYQILQGVQYLHSKGILHRDLKPQNMLVTEKTEIKICDFGLSRILKKENQTLSSEIQTLWYRAPQLILGSQNYDFSVDIWSVGCIFFELVEGKILFQGDSQIGQLYKIFSALGTPSPENQPELAHLPFYKENFPKLKPELKYKKMDGNELNFLYKLMQINPVKRMTAKEALEHSYFDSLKDL